jgi:hypothetical protein
MRSAIHQGKTCAAGILLTAKGRTRGQAGCSTPPWSSVRRARLLISLLILLAIKSPAAAAA